MDDVKYGLGEAAQNLDLTRPMRSRISDDLVPPPVPQDRGNQQGPALSVRFDPKMIAEKIWSNLLSAGSGSEFEARFHLRNGKGFILKGDKEQFGSIHPVEPFMEVHERLIEIYHKEMIKIDLFMEDRAMAFSSYYDLLEWLEI